MGKLNSKWDIRFLGLAEHVSNWSKDPSTQVGAVIVDDEKKIVSLGYNGLPSQVADMSSILSNRYEKYKYIIHAETNAILTAKSSVKDCTLYTFPFLPCTNCASMIIQAGIKCVVSFECIDNRWKAALEDSKSLFEMADVECVEYQLSF
jgi:dCMP deaminase